MLRCSCRFLAIGAFVHSLSAGAWAADYFVATTGSDDNPGTESQPFSTIRRGVAAANAPGDIVYLRGGTYAGGWDNQLNPTFSGAAGSPITFKAYPGEVPILDGSDLADSGASGVEPNETPVSHVRIEGLVARNWPTSGFSNGWNYPSSDMEFVNCIAENNGVNGIAFYNASNVRIEGSMAVHNGALEPSFSSGINLFGATGNNVVEGNVSFENIDVSSNASDGSGFILDENSTHGLFVNNIAFFNGGSCIRLTRSSGGQLINNTCILNGRDDTVSFNDEIYVSDMQSAMGAALVNNVLYPGKAALGGNTIANQANNVIVDDAGVFTSTTGVLDFRPSGSASNLIDQGTSSDAPSNDVGFDPRCITSGSGLGHWWAYVPDYAYIESVGGVAGCFRPGARPSGSGVDVGAYEAGATPAGCASAAECSDGNDCTSDACGVNGQCSNLPIEGCCVADVDCADDDACTIDSCAQDSGLCSNVVDPQCGEGNSGQWEYEPSSGYVSVCDWGGYAWTASGPAEAGVNGTLSSIEEVGELCYDGVVSAQDGYSGYAMLGVNIQQAPGANTSAENIAPGGDGLNISITNNTDAVLRVQIQDDLGGEDAAHRWCVEVDGSGGFFPWSDFNTQCWDSASGVPYAGEPINVIAVMVAGHNVDDIPFDFCLNQFSPSGVECSAGSDASSATNDTGSSTSATSTTGGSGATTGSAVATGAGGTMAGTPGAPARDGSASGCACSLVARKGSAVPPSAGFGLLILLLYRRRSVSEASRA